MLDLERDSCNFKTKPFDVVFILRFYGLRFLVCMAGDVMVSTLICSLLALEILLEALNK